jgi:hypothetical protein
MSRSLSVSSKFFCSSFKVSGLTLRFVIHFEFVFVYCEIQGSSFRLLHVNTQFFQYHLLKEMCFHQHVFVPFSKKTLRVIPLWDYFWILYFVTMFYLCLYVHVTMLFLLLWFCSIIRNQVL